MMPENAAVSTWVAFSLSATPCATAFHSTPMTKTVSATLMPTARMIATRSTWFPLRDPVGVGGVADGVGGSEDVVIELHEAPVDESPWHLLDLLLQELPVGVL